MSAACKRRAAFRPSAVPPAWALVGLTGLLPSDRSLSARPSPSAPTTSTDVQGRQTQEAGPSPYGIGRKASQAAHMNPGHFCQGVGMSRNARTPISIMIRRLGVRSAQLTLVSLSLVASPVAADGRAGPGPSSLQVNGTVSASPQMQDNPTNTTVQPRSPTCLADPRAIVVFDRLDRDSDGRLTRADSRRREAGRDRIRVIASDRHSSRFDLDGDGIATRQEVVAASSCASLMRQGQMPTADKVSRHAQDHESPQIDVYRCADCGP